MMPDRRRLRATAAAALAMAVVVVAPAAPAVPVVLVGDPYGLGMVVDIDVSLAREVDLR